MRRGAAAVEFALVMPLMVGLMLGMIEMGRALQIQQMLVNATREGAKIVSEPFGPPSPPWEKSPGTQEGATEVIVECLSHLLAGSTDPSVGDHIVEITPVIKYEPVYVGGNLDYTIVTVSIPFEQVALFPPFILRDKSLTHKAVFRDEKVRD